METHADFENRGLYYAATAMESLLCREREIIVVGGGNSAGKAALYLSGTARHVHHIIRGSSLSSTMSEYLISRIERSLFITLHTNTEIEKLEGTSTLEFVTWINRKTGQKTRKPITTVFVMIGAEPNSGWLYGTVKLDKKGFYPHRNLICPRTKAKSAHLCRSRGVLSPYIGRPQNIKAF